MFSVDRDDPFVPDSSCERFRLATDFIHRKHTPLLRQVLALEPAIHAVVDTVIAHIKRGERHDPVVIDLQLDPESRLPHFLKHRRIFDADQLGQFSRRKRFDFEGLCEDLPDTIRGRLRRTFDLIPDPVVWM